MKRKEGNLALGEDKKILNEYFLWVTNIFYLLIWLSVFLRISKIVVMFLKPFIWLVSLILEILSIVCLVLSISTRDKKVGTVMFYMFLFNFIVGYLVNFG